MPRAQANGIELEYESLGDPHAPPMLMIMGLASQMIVWPDELCQLLVERGFRVIRFDNRDVGLSTKPAGFYSLDEMANDATGLLDALELPSAHIVGVSMGGFIAQLVAIHHPQRVRSLCIMMSSTGARDVGAPDPDILPMLMQPLPAEREAHLAHRLPIARRLSSPAYPFDEARLRRVYGAAFDRCFFPLGGQRHLAAVMSASDRTTSLAAIRAPTLVIHGDADPIVNVSGGKAIANAIPNAKLQILPGLGHDFPAALWPTFADAIAGNAR